MSKIPPPLLLLRNDGELPSGFVRFVREKCIGYSEDFSLTYYEDVIELADGSQQTVYGIFKEGNAKGFFIDFPPYVAKPLPPNKVSTTVDTLP